MQKANVFLVLFAAIALQALCPITSLAGDGGEPGKRTGQVGEDRWVPSLAITSGITIQQQRGFAYSELVSGTNPVFLRGAVEGNDLSVAPFVGGSLEVMTPALAIPTRPRLFVSAEILPTFASSRDLALEGNPTCVRGPEPDAPCARDEPAGWRRTPFNEESANGEGTRTSAKIDTLVFGANVGVAFPVQLGDRQIRIKPSLGWIHYEVEASGRVVDGACDPTSRCTDVTPFPGTTFDGFLRETILTASDSRRFNGIGPGLDVEIDTGQFGSLGVSLFLGGRAYYILGDRRISFSTSETFVDQIGTDRAVGRFEVGVASWMLRAHAGLRVQWLGSWR